MIDDKAQESIMEAYERTVLSEGNDWISKLRSGFAKFDTSLSTADFYSNGYKKEYNEIDKHLEKVNNILTGILKKERSK